MPAPDKGVLADYELLSLVTGQVMQGTSVADDNYTVDTDKVTRSLELAKEIIRQAKASQ